MGLIALLSSGVDFRPSDYCETDKSMLIVILLLFYYFNVPSAHTALNRTLATGR